MATLKLSWVGRNKAVQADAPVSHFEANVVPPEGWHVRVEWRFRADPGDAWGEASVRLVYPPVFHDDYDAPGDGWVQVTSYAIQDGRVSRGIVREFEVDGSGDIIYPYTRITESGDRRITESGDVRITE